MPGDYPDFLITQRPVVGRCRLGSDIETVPAGDILGFAAIEGHGIIYCAMIDVIGAVSRKTDEWAIVLEDQYGMLIDWEMCFDLQMFNVAAPYVMLQYDEVNYYYTAIIARNISFDTEFYIAYVNNGATDVNVLYYVTYGLIS